MVSTEASLLSAQMPPVANLPCRGLNASVWTLSLSLLHLLRRLARISDVRLATLAGRLHLATRPDFHGLQLHFLLRVDLPLPPLQKIVDQFNRSLAQRRLSGPFNDPNRLRNLDLPNQLRPGLSGA